MSSKQKHVHWSDDPEPDHTPRTPSPAFSLSSDPSSPPPITPPNYPVQYLHPAALVQVHSPASPYYLTSPQTITRPHSRTPSPLTLKDIRVHPLLAAPKYRDERLAFNWDVSHSPHAITNYSGTVSQRLSEPATEPPLACIVLKPAGQAFHHPWTIVVRPGDGSHYASPKPYVSVGDVIWGLERHLQAQVTMKEYGDMRQKLPAMRQAVDAVFEARCAARGAERDVLYERNQGIKRVDYLTGSLIWAGLVADQPIRLHTGELADVLVVALQYGRSRH